MNIFSGEKGLGAALTNPTELARKKGNLVHSYPVRYKGYLFPDAETAYITMRGDDHEENDHLMMDILAHKFIQHPRLFNDVKNLGGVSFLELCTHWTKAKSTRAKLWEGEGIKSRLIRNLIGGFERALQKQYEMDNMNDFSSG